MEQDRSPFTVEDREDISRGIAQKMSNKEIAVVIGRDDSVVCREIARNGGREGYRAVAAQRRAEEQRRRPKVRKMDRDPRLRDHVLEALRLGDSPDQVAGRLRYELGCGMVEGMERISHESVYTYTRCRRAKWRGWVFR